MKLSNTCQRRVIMEELRKLKCHPTADELYCIVKQRLPKISLATVYRNLGLLADAGEIKRIELAGRQSRYDGDTSIHYHLRCRKCGAVEDLHIDRSKSLNRDLEGMLSGRALALEKIRLFDPDHKLGQKECL